jgi:hypothetical protein
MRVAAKFIVIKGPGCENIQMTLMLTEVADSTKLPSYVVTELKPLPKMQLAIGANNNMSN